MKIFSFLIFVASLINATHIHDADIDHKDSWLGGILKFATSKKYQRSGLSEGAHTVRLAHAVHAVSTLSLDSRPGQFCSSDYWSEKYDHLGNNDKEGVGTEAADYGDDYDDDVYDDIENYDTKTALEKLDLGWGLNSTSIVGLGFPLRKKLYLWQHDFFVSNS